ncbi:MAG: glycosyltransferase [Desulfuromonadaceae bacterium]|nr:glycosyltransferase [Desulfuromonadaceae bacterium]MDD2854100.1 glycosyltransferase [Desulfuromonadaceae bacterium]
MSETAQISIITVVKNGSEYLEETILSVIEKMETYLIDYIIIDGGSSDGTTDIINKYSKYITNWVSEPDKGIYDAMNKGWSIASDNSFIMFLGVGDRIISLPANMNIYSVDHVIYGSVKVGGGVVFKPRSDYHLNLYNSLHHQALLVNKSLHLSPPFNCSYQVYADFDFNQRLKKLGAKFIYAVDFVGYAIPGGISDSGEFAESYSIIKENEGYFWSTLALSGYYAMKLFPFFKQLRPYRKILN